MEKRYTIGVMIGNANSPHTMNLMQGYKQLVTVQRLAGHEKTDGVD